MIHVSDMPGWFINEESAQRCRNLLLMMENAARPQQAIDNRNAPRTPPEPITRPEPCSEPCHHNNELWIVSDEKETYISSSGVLRASVESSRLPIRKQAGIVGNNGVERADGTMVRMRVMRSQLCAGERVIVWPS